MFEMDPKQGEWSMLQSNFILQMTGLGNAAAGAKCLECHWKVTHCNHTLLFVHTVHCRLFELDIFIFIYHPS